jgi:hypothetical protein
VTKGPFERALVRKGKSALKVARLALNAELFVQTVERVFSLDKPSSAKEYENPTSKDDDKVSEPAVAITEIERKSVKLEPISLEKIRHRPCQ